MRQTTRDPRLALPAAVTAVVWLCGAMETAAGPIDFKGDVQPIFKKHCVSCHGVNRQEGGLRLDYRGGLLRGGDHGPAIVPGQADGSRLMARVFGTDPEGPRMPFEKPPLTAEQIELLRIWIDQGADWPGSPDQPPRRTSRHWAFQNVSRPALPNLRQTDWPRNAIDPFILKRLEERGIAPSPEADRYTLIRRVYLDLLGVPPTPQEADVFVNDASPNAYEQMVDRTLESPAYGERWGRHWLDQARYADSHGYAIDGDRVMWPYRDWVIDAINADMPFDQFTVEQLAGDLLPGATLSQLIATGFHRNTLINQEGGTDPEQFRVEAVVDRVNTTGAVWLGLTLGCAQCHTHKYDPLTQREYFQLYAFFNSGEDRNSLAPTIVLPTEAQRAQLEQFRRQIAEVRRQLEALEEGDEARADLETELKELTDARTALQRGVTTAMVMRDLPEPRTTHVQIRGDFLRPGAVVEADVPEVLPPLTVGGERASRLDLAQWLVSADNPLTPRVTVNRVWMRFFGKGLVETENDFGLQGTRPTHPELLEWLADEFIRGGWSMKRLHRLIVTSATYRQSSHARPDLHEVDPLNRLLARQQRLRVEAEVLRDTALAASGALTSTIGGPSVYPPQPEGVYAFTQVNKRWPTEGGANRFRRGMYTFFYRSAPHPLLASFDTPDFQTTCTSRIRSNTPLQALTTANDRAMFELAQFLAGRAMREAHDDRTRMERLFRLGLTRPPQPAELERLAAYWRLQVERLEDQPSAAELTAPADVPPDIHAAEAAAWVAAARAIMNLDEFITRP